MKESIDCMSDARLPEWIGSGGLRWNVSGFGCDRPFTVQIDRIEQIRRAVSTIDEELLAQKSEIVRRKHIPNSTRVGASDIKIEAKGPFFTFANSFDFTKHCVEQNRALNLMQRVDFENVRQRGKLESLIASLESLSRRVDHGSIVVVGETFLYDVLKKAMRDLPRVVVCRSGYGGSRRTSAPSLRKPAEDSLLYWLCTPRDAETVGAILLVGSGTFELDIQAIRDSLDVDIVKIVPTTTSSCTQVDRLPSNGLRSGLPKISIVTVSFNQAAFLERTIESVLTQEYPNLEYVIVDGGSTDGSVRIIDRYREHFNSIVIEPDNGQSDALNKGFRLTSGEVMNWLCSDDLLEPNSLYRVAQTYLSPTSQTSYVADASALVAHGKSSWLVIILPLCWEKQFQLIHSICFGL